MDIDSTASAIFCETIAPHSQLTDFPHRNTLAALMSLIAVIEGIKDAIHTLPQLHHRNAIYILYRSLIEHHLKLLYITLRCRFEDKDDVGQEYRYVGRFEESVLWGIAKIASIKAQGLSELDIDIRKEAIKFFPDIAKKSPKEIQKITENFKYKKIINYLSRLNMGLVSEESPLFADMLEAYPVLSSFVHGGAQAMNLSESLEGDGYIYDAIKSSSYINTTSKTYVLLLLSKYYPDFSAACEKLSDTILTHYEAS